MTFFRGIILFLLLVLTIAMVAIAYFLYQSHGNTAGYGAASTEQTRDSVTTAGAADVAPVADAVPATGLVIDISTLPETQQAVLKTLGYENTITFTPEMISCAEGKLGSARVTEIKNGATPSVLESASLMGCI